MVAPVESILVRGVNWLGDAIMTTPALLRLRGAKPNARITLLTHEKLAGLWARQPVIDEVLTFSPEEGVLPIARRLRAKNFTASLAFPNSIRSALELWLARIPRRIGVSRPGSFVLLTETVRLRADAIKMRKLSDEEIRNRISLECEPTVFPDTAHHVHHYLNLVATLGASAEPMPPRLEVFEDEIGPARHKFGLTHDPQHPWFGLNPGAEYGPAKRWPAEKFVETARQLREKTGCRWIIFGGKGDLSLAETIAGDIAKNCGVAPLNLAGKTSLRELAAAMKICEFVLTNDTGPMHLAAAVGTPMVAIFGSTSPELTGPVFSPSARIVRSNAPCTPCFRAVCPIDLRCLRGIEPAHVVAAVQPVISSRKTSPG